MPPIISIVGKPKSGKTTLIERLIAELKKRGYQVATIKHSVHPLDFDKPGKDSWRHIKAGSGATAVVSPGELILIDKQARQPDLNEIERLFGSGFDIILTEGFKQGRSPKVQVHRRTAGPLLNDLDNLIAIATDEPVETPVKQFSIDDITGLADLLENEYIKPNRRLK